MRSNYKHKTLLIFIKLLLLHLIFRLLSMRTRKGLKALKDTLSFHLRFSIKNKMDGAWSFCLKIFRSVFIFLPSLFLILATEKVPLLTKEYFQCYLNKRCTPEFEIEKGIFFSISIIMTAVFIVHDVFLDAKKKKGKSTETFNKKLWHTELKAFADNIKLTSNDRVSFYISFSNNFIMVGRESPNNRFKAAGRKFYKSGIIEKAFANDNSWQTIVTDPSTDYVGYVTEVMTKSNMSESDVRNLTMDSRCLYAKKITKLNNDPIGVLLIETIKPDFSHITSQCGTPIDPNRLERIFDREGKRFAHYLDQFELPKELFEFEEIQI